MLTVGSLFAGIGGLELGLEMTGGFKTVWQVENDEYATRVLERHWPDVRRWGDVRTFPPDAECDQSPERRTEQQESVCEAWRVDLICGGFPCQDISYAGKGAGLGGERSGLFYEAARIIRVLGPRWVVLENVSALLTRGIDAVLGTLASLGYDAEWHCIPAGAVGAPHIRDRVFVLGYAQQPPENAHAPGRGSWDTACESGGDVPDALGTGERQKSPGLHNKKQAIQIANGKRLWDGANTSGGWAVEPAVGRVAHGVPARVDRLRCLGNAVVPQVAYYIGQRILAAEDQR